MLYSFKYCHIYSARKSCAPSPDLPVVIQLHQFCISFLSLSLLCDFHLKTHSPTYSAFHSRGWMKSVVLLFCPGPTNSLLISHPFSFLVHFYLVTYIVYLFRILQFRTCPHLSPYSMLFIIWGTIHYSVGRTTSVWTVSQFVDLVIAGRLLLPSASHVPSLGMECSLGVYQHLLIRLPTGQLGIYYGVLCYSPVSLWPKDDSLFLSHLLTLCWMDEHFLFCILNLFIHSCKYGGIDSRALFE